MASAAPHDAPPLSAVQRYFEVSLFLLVSTGLLADRLDRQARLRFGSDSIDRAGLQRHSASGADAVRNFRRASRRGWCSAISCFSRSTCGCFRANLAEGAPNPTLYAALLAVDSPASVRDACAAVFRDDESRLRFPGRARGHVDAGVGDSDGRDGLSGRAGDFSGAGGLDVRCARNPAQRGGRGFAAVRTGLAGWRGN